MTSQLAAAFQSSLQFQVPALVLATVLVTAWAAYLPYNVRDADGRKLPPNLIARAALIAIYLIVFLGLVAAFAVGGAKMEQMLEATLTNNQGGIWQTVINYFKGQAPLLALTVLAFPHTLPYFRDLENGVVRWLHSAFYHRTDLNDLGLHLRKCTFTPTPAEREKNVAYLREFDVYVDDGDPVVRLESVIAWRKTSSILRLLRQWNAGDDHILDPADMKVLAEIEKAHARKTRLAMDIIRMLRLQQRGVRGGLPPDTVGNLAMILSSASHGDRQEVDRLEGKVEAMLDHGAPAAQGSMHLSSEELQHHLSQIDKYFRVEYGLLLAQASDLTSKSVVLAGDLAPERLDGLKAVGFGQLGSIESISLDRTLYVLFAVALLAFLFLFFWPMPGTAGSSGIPPALMARIALVTALATLVGAWIGSSRDAVRRKYTPWRRYAGAGLLAVAMFVFVHGTAFLFDKISRQSAEPAVAAQTVQPASQSASPVAAPSPPAAAGAESSGPQAAPAGFRGPTKFRSLLPFAATPFFIAVAICWLARQPHWPRPAAVPERIWDRTLDGLALVIAVFCGQAVAMALHLGIPTQIGVMMSANMDNSGISPLYFILRSPFLPLAFVIGAIVVRDVRLAAHAQLTDKAALEALGDHDQTLHPADWPLPGAPARLATGAAS